MAKNSIDPLALIQNDQDDLFQEGIALLEEKGNLSQLKELVRIYVGEASPSRRTALHALLSSITKKGIREAWMDLLTEIQNPKERQQVVQILWNTRLDFSPYLVAFVHWAFEGDYQNTLESLTVIEQMEGPFLEEHLLEAQCLIQEHLGEDKKEGEQKQRLLGELSLWVAQTIERNDLFID
ncbi:MAG: hypothetical protein EBV19_09850 [Flavobacteriia bacterium]|jgi:hypothetical protein|nr:hypothetical protein [Flavobacteriia bacterium]